MSKLLIANLIVINTWRLEEENTIEINNLVINGTAIDVPNLLLRENQKLIITYKPHNMVTVEIEYS